MENFTYYSPTYFAFGMDRESDCGELVKRFGGSKVLIHYCGGSVVRSGLLERVEEELRFRSSFVQKHYSALLIIDTVERNSLLGGIPQGIMIEWQA